MKNNSLRRRVLVNSHWRGWKGCAWEEARAPGTAFGVERDLFSVLLESVSCVDYRFVYVDCRASGLRNIR